MSSSRMLGAARVVALAAALALAGSTGGVAAGARENASPKRWVAVFCGSVVDWERAAKSETAKFETVILGLEGRDPNLRKARSLIVGYLGRIVERTRTLARDVKAVGPPAIHNGAKLQAGVIKAFAQLTAVFVGAKRSAEKLPVTSAAAFARQAEALGARIQSGSSSMGAAFTALGKYNTAALEAAAKKDPACQKLG